jgi:hypothetical protein
VFVTAAAQSVLLHPTPDLIDHLGAQPDHIKGIEYRDCVPQVVTDAVAVTAERVQRGLLNASMKPSSRVFNQAL